MPSQNTVLHRRIVIFAVVSLVAGLFGTSLLAGPALASHADLDNNGIITGAGPGGGPHVRIFDPTGTASDISFFAFDKAFRGGVSVRAGDFDDSGFDEFAVAAATGGGPHVKIFDIDNDFVVTALAVVTQTHSFMAYDTAFRGGVRLGAGDTDDDGNFELITGTGPGGGPHVKVFDIGLSAGTRTVSSQFMAFPTTHRGGIWVDTFAVSTTADSDDEIIVGRGLEGLSQIRAFEGDGSLLWTKTAFTSGENPSGDVRVAGIGHEFGNDGPNPEGRVWTATGKDGIPRVGVRDSTDGLLSGDKFLVYPEAFRGGVYIGAIDIHNDGTSGVKDPWIIVGPGAGGGPHVKRFDLDGDLMAGFFAYDRAFRGGVFVDGGIFADDD